MADQEDQFQEDVLVLFAEEGIEWIGHIKAALEELDRGATPEREPKLYDTVIRSLTNLMGSAATVDLASLQKLTLAIIPLLQAIRHKKLTPAPAHVAAIRQGLALLTSAVQVLNTAESKTAAVPNLESIMQLQAEHIQRVVARLKDPAALSPKDEVWKERACLAMAADALLTLKRARPSSLVPSRNLIESVLRRLHRILDQNQTGITAETVSAQVHWMEDRDAHCLKELQERLAGVVTVLGDLKTADGNSASLKRILQDALHDIAFLYERATDIGAVEIAQFLQGVETLLLEIVYRGIVLSPQRLDAVALRVEAGITMAEQWVEMGRAEKAEIEKALAPLLDANLAPK